MRVFLLLSLGALLLTAQSDLAGRIDQIAAAELARQHIPGMAIDAVRDGRVIYAKGFGVASTESHDPVTADTLFRAGQSTKMFVALALVKLSEQGRIRLDAPAGNYIPGLNPKIAAITAHHILSQTTGLKDETQNYGSHDDAALAREVASWDAAAVLIEPGRAFSTSNLGFALAGRLLEAVKGAPFADVMDELLFRPLGMTRTTFRPAVAMTYSLAQGHSADGKVIRPAPDNAAYWAAFSLYSSPSDMARFMSVFLNGGKAGEQELLPASLIATVSKPETPRLGLPNTSYGYGLIIDATRTVPLIRQAGAVLGFDGSMAMEPESRSGVAVFINSPGDAAGIADKVLERVLVTGLGAPVALPPPAGKNVSAYAGRYVNGPATVEVAVDGSRLMVKTTGEPVPVEATTGECFRGGSTNICFAAGLAHMGVRAYRKQ